MFWRSHTFAVVVSLWVKNLVLNNKTKFLTMGRVHLHDNAAKNEQKLQKRLLDLANQNILARDIYDRALPTGPQIGSHFRMQFRCSIFSAGYDHLLLSSFATVKCYILVSSKSSLGLHT